MASTKSKKKYEIVRSALGNYLKLRNYSLARLQANSERRKTDLVLETTNREQKIMNETIKNEISRPNSFLYSNVFCLNNNPAIVDKEFHKLQSFIQSQKSSIRKELFKILPPLLCHLYIEMLKGREWKPAIEFLKKYANLVGTLEPAPSNQFTKVNGTMEETAADIIPITFATSDDQSLAQFRELVTTLSTVTSIQDIENDLLTANFRSCRYEMKFNNRTINALKRFLKDTHVLILQMIQSWIHIETTDDKISDEEEEPIDESMLHNSSSSLNGFTSNLDDLHETDISKFTNLLASPKPAHRELHREERRREDLFPKMEVETAVLHDPQTEEARALHATRYENLVRIDEKINTHQIPILLYTVQNSGNLLCSGNLDQNSCHFACGMEDSTILLWSIDYSIQGGRKPFGKFCSKSCCWHLSNSHDHEDYSSSDESEYFDTGTVQVQQRQIQSAEKRRKFLMQRCSQNTINETGAYTLRGHSNAVTDVLFSQFNPLLITTSRDLTMRTWRASDYSCAAVYRGHNYAIWCVAESTTDLFLATGSRDSTARLWSTDREFPLRIYAGHTQDVTAIAFHPNGNYLATGSVDQTVRLWDITSGKLLRVLTDCRLPIYKIAFSPNGKWLAAAGEESKVRIFDIASSTQIFELKDHTASVSDVVWQSDSQKLATATSNGIIRLYDVSELDGKTNTPSLDIKLNLGQNSVNASTHNNQPNLLYQYGTQCKRLVRLKFNEDNNLTCVGGI